VTARCRIVERHLFVRLGRMRRPIEDVPKA
jgi:hypothetical protein